MSNRGQKRTEAVDELPADKRACNSLERPSTSNLTPPTPMIAVHDGRDADMDTSSSTSGSTRSDGDGEKDSTYGSCDSDNNLRDYYRHQPRGDQSKFKKVLSSLSKEVDESGQLALLTELCELLSFCSDSSLSSLMADSFSPLLVRLARHERNPDVMLLSIRAITYLCDVNPRSSGFLVRHDAVPTLCQRLMVIEYLDVAEQCLQALEKISREQPLACLQSGAIMAVLSYIDFFATSVQRLALSTVVNICQKLSSESTSLFMDAVPILCNLLQYEDRQLVESVATCLIRMVEQVHHSSDMLDEICKHGLVQHALHLIGLNNRTTLCQPTYIGLIGMLVKLASGSTVATKTLFELNLSDTVKDMLSTHDLSHGTQSIPMVEGYHSQMLEVLKLLNELLPPITADQDDQLNTDKETFLLNHPDILQKFGVDLLSVLIQVVNSGANLFLCYGCLSVVNKLVHFSACDALPSLLRTANFSSFLAGVFTRKDHHLILLALQIVETIMLKLPHVFLHSFIKEGVLFAICALLPPDEELKLSPVFDGMRLESDGTQKTVVSDVRKCPCIAFDAGQSSKSPEKATCKLQIDAVQNLAKRIWITYFAAEATNPEKGVTDALQKLQTLSGSLTNLVNESVTDVSSSQQEEDIYDLLHQIVSKLYEKDSISTFEFVESGITKALVNYMLNGRHLVGEEEYIEADHLYIMEKRFEVFGQLLLSCADTYGEEFPLLALTRRLQSALSSVENFPVLSSHMFKTRNSYATVPVGRCTSYPCLKVQFVRGNGETCVRDYSEDVVTVDSFLPLDAIEGYLWPRVSSGEKKNLALGSKDSKKKDSLCSDSPSDSSTSKGKSDGIVSTEMLHVHKLQEEMPDSLCSPAETSSFEQKNMDSTDVIDVHRDSTEQEERSPLQDNGGKNTDNEAAKPKLLFFLEGQQLNSELSLYQSILGQQTVAEHDSIASMSLWTHIYKITYRRYVTSQSSHAKLCSDEAHYSLLSKRALFCQPTPFFSRIFVSDVELKKLGPSYDVLFLLKSLEEINRLRFHLISRKRMDLFAEGRIEDLDNLNMPINEVCPKEFVNSKLTEKLEQQLRYPMTVSVGGMPAWCTQLMAWCPFLFGFEARYKYFHLAAFGRLPVQTHTLPHSNAGGLSGSHGRIPRKKFLVHRDEILESAAKMMELYARQNVLLEVEYNEEVGSGLGPTLEFYTLVCHEFQRSGLGLWRDDHVLEAENSACLVSPFGLFPRPLSPAITTSSSPTYFEVIKKFGLLGQMVAKALQDGRILDLPFSKTFYKLILGKELTVFDIQSIDPTFCRTLLEFQAIVEKKRYLRSLCKEKSDDLDVSFRSTKIEDLCLDFTLPGYPDYVLDSASDSKLVNLCNLEEYVKLMVDATVKSGISRQVEAFKSGFNQVFPIRHLKLFTEEELERLLCGEHVLWKSDELMDHVKFDHGYTVSSPPIINLLEIMQEFDCKQQRAFLQFVTGAPRLPTGGLASLNPKLTIVRKHCSKYIDADLPSVMTCANYLKLPPYSSKKVMKEKLLYAITEGQGSFHLS